MKRFNKKKLRIHQGYLYFGREPCHRIIWREDVGPISAGYDIHHKDGNSFNNLVENLECISKSDHMKLHSLEFKESRSKNMSKNSEKLHAWHRTEEGRKFLKEKGRKEFERRIPKSCTCAHCGKQFSSVHTIPTKFCSNNCMSAERRASGKDNETRSCIICSKDFVINKYQLTKTCSKPCRAKYIGNLKRKVKPIFSQKTSLQ